MFVEDASNALWLNLAYRNAPAWPAMYPRKPLPHADQIARMKRYLRRLRTELHHRYDEFFEATKGRRECAFEVHLRDRLLEATRDTVALAEACLEELRRQEAMFYAPYKPGGPCCRRISSRPSNAHTRSIPDYRRVSRQARRVSLRSRRTYEEGHHARPSRTALAVPSPRIDDATQRRARLRRCGAGSQLLS